MDTRSLARKLAVVTRTRVGDWLEDEVSGWRDAGLDAVVSLLESDEAAQLGLDDERKHHPNPKDFDSSRFRFQTGEYPHRLGDALKFPTRLSAALGAGENVAVHCRQGFAASRLSACA